MTTALNADKGLEAAKVAISNLMRSFCLGLLHERKKQNPLRQRPTKNLKYYSQMRLNLHSNV
jgi:hypothetical protein